MVPGTRSVRRASGLVQTALASLIVSEAQYTQQVCACLGLSQLLLALFEDSGHSDQYASPAATNSSGVTSFAPIENLIVRPRT